MGVPKKDQRGQFNEIKWNKMQSRLTPEHQEVAKRLISRHFGDGNTYRDFFNGGNIQLRWQQLHEKARYKFLKIYLKI